MSLKVQGKTSGNIAEVNTDNELLVALPKILNDTGYAVVVGELNDGTNGASILRRPISVSPDNRLKVGLDQLQWSDLFNTTLLDSGSYSANTSTMTITEAAGNLNLNAGLSTASLAVARVQSYRTIPLTGGGSTGITFRARFTLAQQTNNQAELGLGFATGIALATDGVYFKLNNTGLLQGVVNFNGVESTVALQSTGTPLPNVYYNFLIVLDQQRVEFYVNGLLEGVWIAPTTAPAVIFSRGLPILMRLFNTAATTGAQQLQIAEVVSLTHDLDNNRAWPIVQAGMGKNAINVSRGVTSGQTANIVNSTAPANATLSNTAASYSTLGGQFEFVAPTGAETDYALFAFQVPLAASGSANSNLVITGIHLECYNMGAAVATTPTLLQWSLGIGSTGVSLATADSLTTGTRAPRKIALGTHSLPIGAPPGQNAPWIDMQFASPLFVEAGTFFHVIVKLPVSTATASQIIRGTVTPNGYYE